MTCGFAGCATDASQPQAGRIVPTELTGEKAKTALVRLIQSSQPGKLKDFPLDQFFREKVKAGKSSSQSWGPFSFHLKERRYSYSRAFGEPPRVCRWHYRGAFDFRDGEWVALPPEVESQELDAE